MRKRDETKIQKIQNAVAELILAEGAANVSTVKVAKRVGIAQSNVYLYFKNKEDLLLSAYHRELERIQQAGGMDSLGDKTIAIQERVAIYLQSIYQFSLAYPDSLTIIQQIKSLHLFKEDEYRTNSLVMDMLKDGIQQGYLKPLPVDLHMTAVFNIMHRHALNIKEGQYGVTDYSYEAIAGMVLDAIRR